MLSSIQFSSKSNNCLCEKCSQLAGNSCLLMEALIIGTSSQIIDWNSHYTIWIENEQEDIYKWKSRANECQMTGTMRRKTVYITWQFPCHYSITNFVCYSKVLWVYTRPLYARLWYEIVTCFFFFTSFDILIGTLGRFCWWMVPINFNSGPLDVQFIKCHT